MHPSTGLDLDPCNHFLETVGIVGMFLFCHTSSAKKKMAINKFHLIPPKSNYSLSMHTLAGGEAKR